MATAVAVDDDADDYIFSTSKELNTTITIMGGNTETSYLGGKSTSIAGNVVFHGPGKPDSEADIVFPDLIDGFCLLSNSR